MMASFQEFCIEEEKSDSFPSLFLDGNINAPMHKIECPGVFSAAPIEHDMSSQASMSFNALEESSISQQSLDHNHLLVREVPRRMTRQESAMSAMNESVFVGCHNSFSDFSPNLDDWTLVKILGEGNFGQVWQVMRSDPKMDDGRSYALKMLSKHQLVCDGEVKSVLEEKRLLKMCNQHPFVTQLRNAWQDDNLIYLLQDFIQGGELYTRMLDENADFDPNEMPPRWAMEESHVQFYTACIADALHYLHSKRICYRDLKPENVMLDGEGYPVLIDLGAAKHLRLDEEFTYTMCGTPRYVAPEMVEGSGHAFGVDHWALAILTYEMLTGLHPFDEWDNNDDPSLFAAIVENDYLPLPDSVSAEARDWIEQLLVKKPTERLGYVAPEGFVKITRDRKSALLKHPWLAKMKMTLLRDREYEAPWRPVIAGFHDSSCFDSWDHLEPVVQSKYPRLDTKEAALFDGFDDL